MSNGGLDESLEHRLIRSKVGDKNVLSAMKSTHAVLGAEPSGHVIFLDGNMPAGDGLYAALRILQWGSHQYKLVGFIILHQQHIRFDATIPEPY